MKRVFFLNLLVQALIPSFHLIIGPVVFIAIEVKNIRFCRKKLENIIEVLDPIYRLYTRDLTGVFFVVLVTFPNLQVFIRFTYE